MICYHSKIKEKKFNIYKDKNKNEHIFFQKWHEVMISKYLKDIILVSKTLIHF